MDRFRPPVALPTMGNQGGYSTFPATLCASLLVSSMSSLGCSDDGRTDGDGSLDGEPVEGEPVEGEPVAHGGSGAGVGDQTVCGIENTCVQEGPRDVVKWPFEQCSPFNHPLGDGATLEPIRPRLENDGWDKYGSWVEDWSTFGCMQTGDNAFYVEGQQPAYQGTLRNQKGTQEFSLLLPEGISEPDDVDRHLFVLDPAKDLVIETLHAEVDGQGDIEALWVLSGQLTDSGVLEPSLEPKHRGTRAYGGSAIAGVIRSGELENGIPHAIAIKVPPDAMNKNGPDGTCWRWPATACDGSADDEYTDRGNVFMGSHLAIPADADLSFIEDPRIRNVAVALQNYGAFVVDAGSPIKYGDGFPGCVVYMGEWNNPEAVAISKMWEQMGRMTSLLQVVTNSGPEKLGGGGQPRTCFAPPLD